ncbi:MULTISPECIES: exopolysaccharide production repressor protein [unclassified Rhizobium]|uniref:exopolysaccharide production repressor protein n=1 Tax=unclassified Rhizobium TaxID=2613769 RepID=UPI001EF8C374|nr:MULTISPECIES: exopolysaccharide production repressor protein [unclassified Rhizobium]ULJ82598.1 exopolysaccharide production repressor protein [Rhizobium sp. C104]
MIADAVSTPAHGEVMHVHRVDESGEIVGVDAVETLDERTGSKTLPFRTFFCILLLVTCTSAVSAYAASLSIFKAFAVTLAASFLLQVIYFLSLLFMSFRPTRESDRSIHSGTWQADQPQKRDRDETEQSNVPQLDPRRKRRTP